MPKSNYEFKCVNSLDLPFILKKYLGEEVTENDKIFQLIDNKNIVFFCKTKSTFFVK